MTSADEDLGKRWEQFKNESWVRTNYTNKFEEFGYLCLYFTIVVRLVWSTKHNLKKDEDGNEVDWRTDPKARGEYFDQGIGIDYE